MTICLFLLLQSQSCKFKSGDMIYKKIPRNQRIQSLLCLLEIQHVIL